MAKVFVAVDILLYQGAIDMKIANPLMRKS